MLKCGLFRADVRLAQSLLAPFAAAPNALSQRCFWVALHRTFANKATRNGAARDSACLCLSHILFLSLMIAPSRCDDDSRSNRVLRIL